MLTLQETANKIGEQMRALHAQCSATSPALAAAAAELHDTLAVGFVEHLEPLGCDWAQAAGGGAPAPKGQVQTNAGVKTKPPVTSDQ